MRQRWRPHHEIMALRHHLAAAASRGGQPENRTVTGNHGTSSEAQRKRQRPGTQAKTRSL